MSDEAEAALSAPKEQNTPSKELLLVRELVDGLLKTQLNYSIMGNREEADFRDASVVDTSSPLRGDPKPGPGYPLPNPPLTEKLRTTLVERVTQTALKYIDGMDGAVAADGTITDDEMKKYFQATRTDGAMKYVGGMDPMSKGELYQQPAQTINVKTAKEELAKVSAQLAEQLKQCDTLSYKVVNDIASSLSPKKALVRQ